MLTLQIQFLGDFRLLYDDQPVMMAQHVRLQSLLAYPVVHRGAPQARQHIAFLFWPDASEAQARANLRKALRELRRLLPFLDTFLQIEEQCLQWRGPAAATVDVALFAASLAQAEQTSQPELAQAALHGPVALDLCSNCVIVGDVEKTLLRCESHYARPGHLVAVSSARPFQVRPSCCLPHSFCPCSRQMPRSPTVGATWRMWAP